MASPPLRDSPALDTALAAALAAVRLPPSFHATVKEYVFDFRDHWRLCCGSGCDPCADTLAKVVDRVRRQFGIRPG